MDALSLILPTPMVANPGPNGADAGAFETGDDAASMDFAALLAAGLMPQVDVAGNTPAAVSQPGDSALEAVSGATAGETGTASLSAILPHALHSGVMAEAEASANSSSELAWSAHAALDSSTQASGKSGVALAAEAATIAGNPEELGTLPLAADNAARGLDAPGSDSQLAVAEPSAPLGHMLHLGAGEKSMPAQPVAMLDVAAPVQSPDFARALSQQVVWMADKDAQIAELRINPPELGPVEVRLQVAGDEAVVQFASAHAEVRTAIEAAIARLRESMAQAGIQLGEASVSAESFREQAAHHHGNGGNHGRYREAEAAEPAWTSTPIASAVRRGLVDLFA